MNIVFVGQYYQNAEVRNTSMYVQTNEYVI
jgi:hypothetical protein